MTRAALSLLFIFVIFPTCALAQSAGVPASAATGSCEPTRVTEADAMKFLDTSVLPKYPEIAKLAQVSGPVVTMVTLAKDGSVVDVKVISGPPMLIKAAQDAVKQWHYGAALLEGKACGVETKATIAFTLDAGKGKPAIYEDPPADRAVAASGGAATAPSAGSAAANSQNDSSAVTAAPADPRANPPASTVTPAKILNRVAPVYPPEAYTKQAAGTVVVHFTVTKEGIVTDAQFVSGPEEFKDAAIAAVNQWTYEPARVSGRPVKSTVDASFHFKPPPPPPAPVDGAASAGADTLPAAAPQRIRVESNIIAKQLVAQAVPVYPAAAKSARISGHVVMHAIIGTDGAVKELTVVSGPKDLYDTTLQAVRQWRYKPTLLNGVAVEVDTTITVIYTLSG